VGWTRRPQSSCSLTAPGSCGPASWPTGRLAKVVEDICRRLDDLPLAVELAAARLRALPLATLAERLSDRFRLLTGGARTALPRQQALRVVVDWSYDLLFEDERRLFARLAVFSGGCAWPRPKPSVPTSRCRPARSSMR